VSPKSGFNEALKLLQGLSNAEAKKLIELMKQKDPKMAELLAQNLVSLDDLKYLTESMLIHLLRDFDLIEFGAALKTSEDETKEKILSMVSKNMKEDIEFGLNKPRRLSEVTELQERLMELVREKIDKGQIVIDPDGDEFV
jgi:flagellar motor switch protein FliG